MLLDIKTGLCTFRLLYVQLERIERAIREESK
jgi:hypothetical protein